MTNRRQFTQAVIGGAALAATGLPLAALAQNRDVARILVGFPPGGTTDALARLVAEGLRGSYANNVIVENRPGAGGQIAITAVKDAAPDGNTLLLTPSSMLSIYPYTYDRLPYTLNDVAPVSVGCFMSHGFGVGPAVPDSVRNMQDFLAWARANPTQASFGSPGAGSMPHLAAALIGRMSNTALTHVPYRGSAPGIQDLLGGQVSAMCSPVGDYLQHIQTGRLRLLATSGPERTPFTPNVPTFREQGLDLAMREWFGFFLPGTASADLRNRASAALQPVLRNPSIVQNLAERGMEAASSTPEQLAAWLQADSDMWRGIVREIGFKADS